MSSVDREEELVRACYRVFLNRDPENDHVVEFTSKLIREGGVKHLLAHFLLSDEFLRTYPDLHSRVFDKILRRRMQGGFRVPKANFFCVGASRAGTSTLYVLLNRHSGICMSPVKETNFFSNYYDRRVPGGVGLENYEFYYCNWKGESIIADFTPIYLSTHGMPKTLFDYNQEAKILAIVRNPVERAISEYYHLLSFHKDDNMHAFFRSAIFDENDTASIWYSGQSMLRRSRYANDLIEYKQVFRDNFKIIRFEQLLDQRNLLIDLCNFLGVPFQVQMLSNDAPVKLNSSVKKPVDFETKKMLEEYFHEDIIATSETIGEDLTEWL